MDDRKSTASGSTSRATVVNAILWVTQERCNLIIVIASVTALYRRAAGRAPSDRRNLCDRARSDAFARDNVVRVPREASP